jgi:surface antigen
VVYQPGVQGASTLGHVAHVTAVYADGSFRVEEMNYYGFGGGFGHFSYRTSWVGWGVSFIY